MSWKVTKTDFYVFILGNIALPLCMSSHVFMVYTFENIIMTDMMTVIVTLLRYF